MENKDIYASFDYADYKKNKANILSTQMDLLNIMKTIQILKKIKNEKNNLKIQLYFSFEKLLNDLKKINEVLPKLNIPKSIRKKLEPEKKPAQMLKEPSAKEKEQDIDKSIDRELLEIQEKLRRLNFGR